MKRALSLIATLPFWYFAVVYGTNQRAAIQFGPFATQATCDAAAIQFTSPSLVNGTWPKSGNPFYLTNSNATACWSDS